jgi:uncharacterized protein involved in type VI secretion and phage assembly
VRAWSGPAGTAPADGAGTRLFGVYPAIVETLVDPDGLGRVEVSLPWLGDRDGDGAVTAWATLVTPYADEDQGLEIVPEKGSQVLVAFEAGDARRPYVLGACWNGRARLPEAPTAANDKRVLRTREGSLLEFDDRKGAPKVTLRTKAGHVVELDEGARQVTVRHAGGCSVVLTSSQVQVTANGTVEVNASAVNVHAPAATFDGTVSCTTLNASVAVMSPMYSQGAGNVW